MHKGIFITIEGPDGAGKSTQIPHIKQYLEEKGYEVILTREPGGTAIGEKIRKLLLDKDNKEMVATTEALLYAASRAQHIAEVIVPALKEGKAVICDRFVDSSIAYQGSGRQLGMKSIIKINEFATCKLQPDITIFLNIDPEEGLNRVKANKEVDRIEQEKLDFHKKVYKGYVELANMYPQRIKTVNANKSVDKIKEQIKMEIENKLKNIMKED